MSGKGLWVAQRISDNKVSSLILNLQVLQEIGFGMTRALVSGVVIDFLKKVSRPNQFEKPG